MPAPGPTPSGRDPAGATRVGCIGRRSPGRSGGRGGTWRLRSRGTLKNWLPGYGSARSGPRSGTRRGSRRRQRGLVHRARAGLGHNHSRRRRARSRRLHGRRRLHLHNIIRRRRLYFWRSAPDRWRRKWRRKRCSRRSRRHGDRRRRCACGRARSRWRSRNRRSRGRFGRNHYYCWRTVCCSDRSWRHHSWGGRRRCFDGGLGRHCLRRGWSGRCFCLRLGGGHG